MAGSAHRIIRVKWVRSGIGFNYRQKEMVRSLGLRRLNQVVERPDTPQVRGLVARIPHLVEIVKEMPLTVQMAVPEYTLLPPGAVSIEAVTAGEAKAAKKEVRARADETAARRPVGRVASEPAAEKAAREPSPPGKGVKAKKPVKVAAADKTKAVKKGEAKKGKAATGKGAKSSTKSKK